MGGDSQNVEPRIRGTDIFTLNFFILGAEVYLEYSRNRKKVSPRPCESHDILVIKTGNC